jgi:hypothetical protein
MATRRTSRKTARQRRSPAHSQATHSLYRRKLRCEPLEDRRLLATVTVTTALDTVDFSDGLTSLREALFATNLVAGPDTIDFAPALTLSGPATILLTQGELDITDSLTILGPGANLLTIDATGNDPTPDQNNGDGSRVFNIDNGNRLTFIEVAISGLTLTGGDSALHGGAVFSKENLQVSRSAIDGNSALGRGGGIGFTYGSLTLFDSTISSNSAERGGGINGGINFLGGTQPALNIVNSTISGNVAAVLGGGVYAWHTNLSISHSTITGNVTQYRSDRPSWGGGVWVTSANLARRLRLITPSLPATWIKSEIQATPFL